MTGKKNKPMVIILPFKRQSRTLRYQTLSCVDSSKHSDKSHWRVSLMITDKRGFSLSGNYFGNVWPESVSSSRWINADVMECEWCKRTRIEARMGVLMIHQTSVLSMMSQHLVKNQTVQVREETKLFTSHWPSLCVFLTPRRYSRL